MWSPFSETQKGQVQHLVYSMSWTLLVSCNSFKLKINPENDHAIGGARLRITKYLKLPSSAKQCSTWSTQRRNLADGPSADNLGVLPGWNVPKVATIFGHRPQMWLGLLGEQHGTTSCNLKSPCFFVPAKWMIRFVDSCFLNETLRSHKLCPH